MLNGLDLFSGIGGITLALSEWVRPVAYCEIDPYCQGVLLSQMASGSISTAPIWDDIQTLRLDGCGMPEIHIIYGGFPCQDISYAGSGKGLEGERSGLFLHIVRLCGEVKPRFVFLENVPAICTRGGAEVVRQIASLGYDCRWCVISAASVGAMHKRDRWFFLAHSNDTGCKEQRRPGTDAEELASAQCSDICDTESQPSSQADKQTVSVSTERAAWGMHVRECGPFESIDDWQKTVSTMGKCSHGLPYHTHRLKALGNAVVPIQAKTAFKILMGIQ